MRDTSTRGSLIAALLMSSVVLTSSGQKPVEWTIVAPRNAHRTGTTADHRLAETSGAAVSRKNPGVIWTIADSDNPADLLAIDTLGTLLAVMHVADAANVDWEEVALGPCDTQRCVYIADTGDNNEQRSEVQLYRFPEPALIRSPTGAVIETRINGAERLRFRYPDGPHDVEAISVLSNGSVILVTKGRHGGILMFMLPASAWRAREQVVAVRTDSLPIVPSLGTGRVITGMAISPNGTRAVIRSYRELFLFSLDPTGHFHPDLVPTACDVLGLEPQGEGVDFLDDHRLVLTSERGLFKAGSVWIMECQPPAQK